MMIRMTILAVLTAGLLSGCAQRPEPALTPVAVAQGSEQVRMLAVTTRKLSPDARAMFTGERALTANFAELTISVPPDRKAGEIIWPTTTPPDARTAFAATDARHTDEAGFRRAFQALSARQGKRAHVLVFIHGYNTRFDEAAFRFAQVTLDTGGNSAVVPVLFSWPSWGTLASYTYDRESAAVSRDALANLLLELSSSPQVGDVTVLAHSMGGWLTMEAMRTVALKRGGIPHKVGDLMLAAPDIDIDVAVTQGRSLGAKRPRITLFSSKDDKALSWSRFAWGSRAQLGSIDASQEPYKSGLARAGVQVIDLSGEDSADRLRHGKFAESPRAVQAIGARLAAGNSLEAGKGEAGAGLSTIAKGAANLIGDIVTAPVTVLSGEASRGPGSTLVAP
jgi:esterase/lipase superfamily enzyme